MDRFGSSLFRIVWALVCLLFTGLVLGAIQGFGGDGNQLIVFGAGIPLNVFDDRNSYISAELGRLIYVLVPAIFMLGAFQPLADAAVGSSRLERFKGLFSGLILCVIHGLFLTQMAMLPIMAASYRLLGTPFSSAVLQADMNALLLGMQLLLWTLALCQIVKSNRGIAIFLAYVLATVGKLASWMGEFGPDLGMSGFMAKAFSFLGHLFPTEVLPSQPLAWKALPLSLGGPLALSLMLMMLPTRKAKAAKTSRATKKG